MGLAVGQESEVSGEFVLYCAFALAEDGFEGGFVGGGVGSATLGPALDWLGGPQQDLVSGFFQQFQVLGSVHCNGYCLPTHSNPVP